MPNYRRYYIPDSIIFITSVTKDRKPYLKSREDIKLFFYTLREVQKIHPFNLQAYVVLPEHFHWLIRLESTQSNFSVIMKSVKMNFTRNYKDAHQIKDNLSLWQRGFWDHVIRDENDLSTHLDYIHWNPIKHGYVTKPEQWENSSYSFWVRSGYYSGKNRKIRTPDEINDLNFE